MGAGGVVCAQAEAAAVAESVHNIIDVLNIIDFLNIDVRNIFIMCLSRNGRSSADRATRACVV
jgi:hypothetical protein